MDYKDTLHMPKTGFEMRGNLTKKEPKYQQRWEEERLYDKMLARRENAKPFVLHDGPPYANGDIHLGHALNKILKDVINKSKFMEGYKVPYIPGWDTHGLPIETAVTKLGFDRKKMGIAEFRKICYDYAMEQVAKQKAGFLSLGSIGDYDHPYITLTKDFEAEQIKIFGKMAMDGLIYKGLKPVYWSPSSESALAEAEVEYKDIKSPTIFVKFNVKDGKGVLDTEDSFVIWTTTPWTIPGNKAIALHPNMEYALVDTDHGKLVVLNELVEDLMPKFDVKEYRVVKTFKGKELEGITTVHPLYPERESLVVLADYVTADAGTGCVHTAPAFGVDDFNTGMRYGLEMDVNVDEQGKLMESTGEDLAGLYVEDANKVVTQKLDELGALLNLTFITHSYPHDWRTKKPIIFRATTQWFASIDKIRDLLLEQIHSISWVPAWGEGRMHNMIADRGDWCISRQRAWGVPIPIFYGEDDTPIMDQAVFDHVAELFAEHGSNIWFEKEADELLPEGYTNEHSPNGIFRKETDTMDVWFDSGSSHTGAMIERGLGYPADLYFEGSDQYRGWFNSSLIVGTAVYGKAPYKQVLSHGFVMDEKGVKMSKSQWNAVAPGEITKKYGADILRLWATSVDYQADCSMGQNILKQVSENYRKVRNTFRFLMANLDNNTFAKADLVPTNDLSDLNKYILVKLNKVADVCLDAYDEYRFADVVSTLTNFMTNELSAYYLDYTKDILYILNEDDPARRQVQTVLYLCLDVLTRLWAPILCHTTEEINDFMHFDEESIHLSEFVKVDVDCDAGRLVHEMDQLLAVRKDVLKALEIARANGLIKKSLEASLKIRLNEETKRLFERIVPNAAQWLIVSKVEFVDGPLTPFEVCEIEVDKAKGHVCPRCWNYTESDHEDGLCDRCAAILEKE
ncbi:isoleucine--tRNA ligase [uncultured Dubosiella sp.]|jgi:isoleucyl-tRNA synthetase|uniref:isoleucine--tRNA ligase n=1 Tax=uncultured Dubosiella sp. TaxID=1937011 RepID=UPI00207E60D3|nr:isoleucine--tRNA ligase [uncultured Dubosiella sp.]GJM58226.1 isoleucine--tRNA ligase [Erysipelotrichaceae bacterium OPF54]